MSERIRIGQGADVHAFARAPEPGRPLMLGCLAWPGEPRLVGHSDGDAVAHALCDALLSAAALGDMGANFGTDRPEWRGASGRAFLAECARLVAARGLRPVNACVTVLAVRPRIGARRAEMERRLTQLLGAPVSVVATTTDGLGFVGRGEGVEVRAVCLLQGG